MEDTRLKRTIKFALISLAIILVVPTFALSTSGIAEAPVSQYQNSSLPVVNVTLYEGEINATTYGFGNTSSSLTSPGPALTFRQGQTYTVTVHNVGAFPHSWAISTQPNLNGQILFNSEILPNAWIQPGETGSITFTPDKTDIFYYICPVPGHTELGMWGRAIVNHPYVYRPGVSPGQFLRYSLNVTATGNDTELLPHVMFQPAWSNVTVVSVTNDSIIFQQVFYNATTTQPVIIKQNVMNGSRNDSILAFPVSFIAANLTEGDPIVLSSFISSTINETAPASFLGQTLETNHHISPYNQSNVNVYGITINETLTLQIYWERKTGIMLEELIEGHTSRSDGTGGTLTTDLTLLILILSAEPQLPVIAEFDSPLILLSLMTAILLIITSVKKRRRSHITPVH